MNFDILRTTSEALCIGSVVQQVALVSNKSLKNIMSNTVLQQQSRNPERQRRKKGRKIFFINSKEG